MINLFLSLTHWIIRLHSLPEISICWLPAKKKKKASILFNSKASKFVGSQSMRGKSWNWHDKKWIEKYPTVTCSLCNRFAPLLTELNCTRLKRSNCKWIFLYEMPLAVSWRLFEKSKLFKIDFQVNTFN